MSSKLVAGRPIFVVGCPRSGTSILTWSLGQHSNILVQEESNWIGRLAIQIELAYQTGTARGSRSQLSALDVTRSDFFAAFGDAIDRLVIGHREKLEARLRAAAKAAKDHKSAVTGEQKSAAPAPGKEGAFQLQRAATDPKQRWIDGTPEYCFYIYPLRRLFPDARFIHIVREVTSVVPSMLNFERTGGPPLVASAAEAFEYWHRSVRACLKAERAYGAEIIRRIAHADLVRQPEQTIRYLLDFLGEPYEPSCLEPLATRINSSKVPVGFQIPENAVDPGTLQKVDELTRELAGTATLGTPDPEAAAALEMEFQSQVNHARTRA